MQAQITDLMQRVGDVLTAHDLMLVTAESCTGGKVASVITDVPGCSKWYERGYVTYSNAAKMQCLGVPESILQRHGAVSEATVNAMASGALVHSAAQVSVAITGVAGPGGGTLEKPVGTVYFGWAREGHIPVTAHKLFTGDRQRIRTAACIFALEGLLSLFDE